MAAKNMKNSGENTSGKSKIVLLLIDVISDFEFEDGEQLFKFALPAAEKIAVLKEKAKKAGVPAIYINDNFGNWRDDFQKTVKYCLENDTRGQKIVELLKPDEDDYFVLKPKHSAFYSTTLDLLLKEMQAENLILTGVTTDICVLFSANDAYMRGYDIFVPSDCVAAVEPDDSAYSLKYIERVLKADIRVSDEIDFEELRKK